MIRYEFSKKKKEEVEDYFKYDTNQNKIQN